MNDTSMERKEKSFSRQKIISRIVVSLSGEKVNFLLWVSIYFLLILLFFHFLYNYFFFSQELYTELKLDDNEASMLDLSMATTQSDTFIEHSNDLMIWVEMNWMNWMNENESDKFSLSTYFEVKISTYYISSFKVKNFEMQKNISKFKTNCIISWFKIYL